MNVTDVQSELLQRHATVYILFSVVSYIYIIVIQTWFLDIADIWSLR